MNNPQSHNKPESRHALPSDIPTSSVFFKSSDHENDNRAHLLIAATGSVAAIKIPLILEQLHTFSNLSVRLVLTNSSLLFLPPLQSLLTHNVNGIYLDHHEWPSNDEYHSSDNSLNEHEESRTAIWSKIGDPILHIELRRWAHLLLIAPLSANSLAKITNGFSDDLLSSVVRAWDPKRPIFVAPAMNTMMWEHPVTNKQIAILEKEWKWFKVLRPVEKMLACGDSGSGGMKEWGQIVKMIVEELGLANQDRAGEIEKEVVKKIPNDQA